MASKLGSHQISHLVSPSGLAPLAQNRVVVTYAGDWAGDLYYAILDSAGNPVFPLTNLSSDGSSPWDSYADAAKLSNGNILIAWQSSEGFFSRERYAVLNPSYGLQSGPTLLSGSPAVGGDGFPSVAPSGANAVITWKDGGVSDSRHLYYALIDGSGSVTTPPMIFWRSELGVFTSDAGYGNTTYHPWVLYLPLVLR